jgi:hypothetical protein
LLLLTFDGALRKWFFPASEQVIFVVKDVLLALLLASALKRRRSTAYAALPGYVQPLLYLYVLWVLLEVFNPSSPGLLVGIWGLKAHLLYAGLILVLPLVFDSLEDVIQSLERLYPLVVIPVSVLALVQLGLGAESALNQQVRGGLEGIASFGEQNLVRVAGPFSYVSGMAAFVQFTSLLGVGLYITGCRSWKFLFALVFAAAVLPVTGSRGVLYVVALGGVGIVTAAYWIGLVRSRYFVYTLAVFAAVASATFYWQNEAWTALQERVAENMEEGAPRLVTAFTNAFAHMDVAGLIGFGTGTANLGAVALSGDAQPFSWFPPGTGFEEESGRVVLELGVVGWLLSLGMRISFLVWALSLTFRGATRSVRAVAVLALPFLMLGVHAGNGVFAPSYMAVGYWFVVALLGMAQREHALGRLVQRSRYVMRSA